MKNLIHVRVRYLREKELKTGFGRKWLKREYAAGRLAARQAGRPKVLDMFAGGGDTIVVGAHGDDTLSGSAYVFGP